MLGKCVCRVLLVALVAALLPAVGAASQGRCSLAGTWWGENDAGLAFIINFDPLDAAHRRYSSQATAGANDPTGFGLFPTAVEATDFLGEVRRTGGRTFDQTALSYVRDTVGWIGTFAVSGSWTLTEDCGTAEVVWQASSFFAGEDPFVDDPFFCFPPTVGTYRRIPVIASSCEP